MEEVAGITPKQKLVSQEGPTKKADVREMEEGTSGTSLSRPKKKARLEHAKVEKEEDESSGVHNSGMEFSDVWLTIGQFLISPEKPRFILARDDVHSLCH